MKGQLQSRSVRRYDDGLVAERLRRPGLERYRQSLPGQLGGDELQRVAIARALVNRPRLLLADEPTGRLERGARERVLGTFRELAADGIGILPATHDIEQARQADRTVELSDGSIVGGDSHRSTR